MSSPSPHSSHKLQKISTFFLFFLTLLALLLVVFLLLIITDLAGIDPKLCLVNCSYSPTKYIVQYALWVLWWPAILGITSDFINLQYIILLVVLASLPLKSVLNSVKLARTRRIINSILIIVIIIITIAIYLVIQSESHTNICDDNRPTSISLGTEILMPENLRIFDEFAASSFEKLQDFKTKYFSVSYDQQDRFQRSVKVAVSGEVDRFDLRFFPIARCVESVWDYAESNKDTYIQIYDTDSRLVAADYDHLMHTVQLADEPTQHYVIKLWQIWYKPVEYQIDIVQLPTK